MSVITDLRTSKGETQEQLAKILNVHQTTIAGYEKGIREPNNDTLLKLSEHYNVSVDYLLTGKESHYLSSPPPQYLTVKQIPVLGRIAAGVPIMQQQDIIDYLHVPEEYADGRHFGLYVNGDSMEPKLPDGCRIIVRQSTEYLENKISVLLIDGEVTVKRAKRLNGHIVLISDNAEKYPPRIIDNKEVIMQGYVVEIMIKA